VYSGGDVSDLAKAVERFGGRHAVVVGDLMLDEYVWGRADRISPEAPVPVVAVEGRNHLPGGAGNVARGIVALGCSASLGGVVGEDDSGARLQEALAEAGVDCEGVIAARGRTTTTKTRVIAHSQQVVRTDLEQSDPISETLAGDLASWGESALDGAHVLVLSDYAKGVLTPPLAQALIETARRHAIPIVVDPKGSDFGRYRGATVLTPNVHDAARAAILMIERREDLLEAARRLQAVLPETYLLVTRGNEGMSLIRDGTSADVAADARNVYDVTGAGDTVVAALAVALAAGLDLADGMALANAAAGIVVEKLGTATVTREELRERLAGRGA
jgi:D-beta-D-heptose 7-phosphate kinase/D-beta-D-heptose 1-phosphate adenosyltransferase